MLKTALNENFPRVFRVRPNFELQITLYSLRAGAILAAILSLNGRYDIYGTEHYLFIYDPNLIFIDVLMLGLNSDTKKELIALFSDILAVF